MKKFHMLGDEEIMAFYCNLFECAVQRIWYYSICTVISWKKISRQSKRNAATKTEMRCGIR